ncbi:MAG: IS3 family transposase [Nitrospira sp.]
MRYRVIQEYDRRDPIRLMCRALAVSPAGYYAWRGRPESTRAVANRDLLAATRLLHHEGRQTYGSPQIWRALREQRHQMGEHRVARLMRQADLQAKTVSLKVAGDHGFGAPLARSRQSPEPAIYRRGRESGMGG